MTPKIGFILFVPTRKGRALSATAPFAVPASPYLC